MQMEIVQMHRKLLTLGIIATSLLSSVSFSAEAGTMTKDKDGNLIVSENSFSRNKIKCHSQWMQISYGGELKADSGYMVEYAYLGKEQPIFLNITESISELVDEAHNMKDLVLKCLPSEEKVGIFAPSQSDEIEPLYIMVLKDARVINGYNLSGHDKTAIDE